MCLLCGAGEGQTSKQPFSGAGFCDSSAPVPFLWWVSDHPSVLQAVSTNMGWLLFGLHGGFCCFLGVGMPPALRQLHLPAPAATAQLRLKTHSCAGCSASVLSDGDWLLSASVCTASASFCLFNPLHFP